MNFKILFLLFITLPIILSCGVKSDPVPPDGPPIPSYQSRFIQEPLPVATPEESKNNEKTKKEK